MIRGIDHLVIACADPDAAAAQLESALGLSVSGGGRHAGRGTFNRIAWLADGSYIELIGVDDREAALAQPVGAAAVRALETRGGGLATYALRDDDLEATAAALGAIGTFGAVTHGSREREDGEIVEWWTSFPTTELAPDAAPFLIEHAYTGAEWGLEALAERARFSHPIGSPVALARLDVAAADPPLTAATLHDQLGIDFWAVADLAVADVGTHVIRLVPTREMAVPAVVTLAADVESPRTAELFGLRFDVERAALPSVVPDRS
ncbi:MAG TPA: VOC family protein [Candidatus Limnocylindria bacterium]|nr:VOC family protein [Candidatus Limnocylindria bacterium]